MRRPLFVVCLCLVAMAAVRLWLFDFSDSGTRLKELPAYIEDGGGEPLTLADGEVITVTGSVYQKDTQSFIIQSNILSETANLRYNYPIDKKLICEFGDELNRSMPKIGSAITVQGVFRSISGASNPGEFDVAGYYRTLGIVGKLTDIIVLSDEEEYSLWRETLYQLRVYFKNRLYAVFPEKEASVLTAMLLGDKEELNKDIKDLYKNNGIIHILSISGLHITMIGMSIYQMLRRLGVPVWLAAICGGSILCLYGVMTGLSVSACRAIGMYLLRMLAEVVGRTYDMLTAVGVVAVIMIWQNPMNLCNAGFLLSFGSILGIGWFYPALLPKEKKEQVQRYETRRWKRILKRIGQEWSKRLAQSILAGGSITIFTLPIQLWFYYEVPVYSIFLNLLVLPFMSLLMVTGLVVMLLPGTGVIGTVTCLVLQGYERLCQCFDQLPFHTWNPGKPEVWQVMLYYVILLAVGFLGEKRKASGRGYLYIPIALTASVIMLSVRFDRETTITFLDVGQGDCIVMETVTGEVFLFDCGSTSKNQVGEYILLPFLKYSGIRQIDAVFVSHPDKDHYSGVEELFAFAKEEGIQVEQLVLPGIAKSAREEKLSALQPSDIPISYVGAGDTFFTECTSFLCLHPPKGYDNEDSNVYSQCFYVEMYDGKRRIAGAKGTAGEPMCSMLLTGDVEGEGEELLMQELISHDIADITALKVAHHGSRYSTSEKFLELVKPRLAVISCGRNNSYGHPHAETLERLEEVGSEVLTTSEYGAVTIEVSLDGKISVSYWVKDTSADLDTSLGCKNGRTGIGYD